MNISSKNPKTQKPKNPQNTPQKNAPDEAHGAQRRALQLAPPSKRLPEVDDRDVGGVGGVGVGGVELAGLDPVLCGGWVGW